MRDVVALIARPFFAKTFQSGLISFISTEACIPQDQVDEHMTKAAAYAQEKDAYIVPPLYERDGQLRLCLIDPNGNTLGEQGGIFLRESYEGFTCAASVNVIDAGFARVFLCVDADAFHPEVARMAAMAGAEIAVCSQFFPRGTFTRQAIQQGAFNIAQANGLYVLSATNIESSIICPITARNRNGFLAQTARVPISAGLSGMTLEKARLQDPVLGRLNGALLRSNYERLG